MTKFTEEYEAKADALASKVEAIVLAVFATKEEDEEITTMELVTEMLLATHVIASEAVDGAADLFDTIAALSRIASDLQLTRIQAKLPDETEEGAE